MTRQIASASSASVSVMQRDLVIAFRQPSEWLHPLAFFLIVTMLFPLALNPELSRLRQLAPAALWVALLLASMLALDFLFREDARDGTLEQFALSGQSFTSLLLAKTATHWLLTGLPLALVAPLAAVALGAPTDSIPGVMLALLLGSLSLSLLGAIGAGLTLGLRKGGALLSLLVLPLAVPTLVFGARATQLAIQGEPAVGALYLLAAITVLAFTLAPLAAAAAVRISLE
jgi:heme exporter protein B